ncbi:hypothetical protein PHYSODRAFT_308273 [Phytophthora sojae]|uniref:Uncharacterized protein n=1 Tax=Phytophthora sojae (strain P6497) TaxID=1094619 RepID=G5AJD5_PHYSP|nr:hypothetical protein PHYSODRAFT_308273 [Phytophthora sojae]EGZ04364.1 hypothetical protein PHYSODRAFT_308273 [Phytophthora sojae]|eukprot:XP_009540186.1 hypothetical protein PHYSODRAFT_308273 [Phytophthora sojae]
MHPKANVDRKPSGFGLRFASVSGKTPCAATSSSTPRKSSHLGLRKPAAEAPGYEPTTQEPETSRQNRDDPYHPSTKATATTEAPEVEEYTTTEAPATENYPSTEAPVNENYPSTEAQRTKTTPPPRPRPTSTTRPPRLRSSNTTPALRRQRPRTTRPPSTEAPVRGDYPTTEAPANENHSSSEAPMRQHYPSTEAPEVSPYQPQTDAPGTRGRLSGESGRNDNGYQRLHVRSADRCGDYSTPESTNKPSWWGWLF